jgi:SRSO17 transposase
MSATIDRFTYHFRNRKCSVMDQAKLYLRGLIQADRKNMERMAEVVDGADHQQLHHFTCYSPWRARPVYDQVAREADAILGGHDDSCLLIDETGVVKKGKNSVGVARQYIGRVGKVDNGQVSVWAVLSNKAHYTFIDTRLYLPKEWTDDPWRCKKAGVPNEEMCFRSKAQLALSMIDNARTNGVRFNWTGMDGGYGKEPWLLRTLDAKGEIFVADVHKDQRIYLTDPEPHIPEKTPGRGRCSTRLQARTTSITVEAWAAQQPKEAWLPVTLRESTRGKLEVKILHQRVWLWDGEEKNAHCWHLIVRQESGSADTIKYSLSNASAEISYERLARMQGARFWVERSLQDGKSNCGMADYQGRNWYGWHRHMAMVMIAMLFMLNERLLQKENIPLLSCADIVELLKNYLPRKAYTEQDLFTQMQMRHKKRQAAIDAAYRKQARAKALE